MIGSLGDIVFETSSSLVRTWDRLEQNQEARFAEHNIIDQKPKLQHLGPALNQFSMRLTLHEGLSDPQAEIDALTALRKAGDPVRLVIGGRSEGLVVVLTIRVLDKARDNQGRLWSAELELRLKEYA